MNANILKIMIEIATVQLIGDKLQLANRLAGQRPLTFRIQPWNPNSEANRNSKCSHLPHNFSSSTWQIIFQTFQHQLLSYFNDWSYFHVSIIKQIVLPVVFRRLVIKLSNSGSLFTEKHLSPPPARWYFSVNSSPSFDNLDNVAYISVISILDQSIAN